MSRIYIAVILSLITALGIAAWHSSRLQEDNKNLSTTIGTQAQFIAQQTQTIHDIEKDKADLLAQYNNAQAVIESNRIDNLELNNNNRLLKRKLEDIEHENQTITDYVNDIVDHDIVKLLPLPPCRSGDNTKSGLCEDSEGAIGGNTRAIYRTRSIINYAIDCSTAIRSCNLDKRSISEFQGRISD